MTNDQLLDLLAKHPYTQLAVRGSYPNYKFFVQGAETPITQFQAIAMAEWLRGPHF